MEPALAEQEVVQHLTAGGYDLLGYRPRAIDVVRYDSVRDTRLWDDFVPETVNGNLFSTRRFLSYHPAGRFEDHSLLFYDRGKLVAIAAGEAGDGGWSSHRFSSHGGLLVLPKMAADRCADLVWSLLSYARVQGWRRLRLRFAPDCLDRGPSEVLHWALEIFGFRQDGRELTWYARPGAQSEDELLAGYDDMARRSVRKARKAGLRVRINSDYAGFWRLLETNLQNRFKTHPTHTLQEIERLRELCPEEISLWSVFDAGGAMLAGSVVFEAGRAGGHTFYFAQDYACQECRPMALLMHELCLEYAVRRQRCLNFGVITARGASELNFGLSRFKQSFGAQPAIRRTFVWEDDRA